MNWTTINAVLTAGLLAACSPTDTAEPPATTPVQVSQHPVSGLEVVPLRVIAGDETHDFAVEVARTGEQQAKGLMFRETLGPNEGMIFPYNPPRRAGFWMKDTPLALDIIFVGSDGRIINIAADTPPQSTDTVFSDGPASLILEIPGGRAAQLGIEPGDRVEW